MIDYTQLTDTDFQAHCTALYAEQDRRAKLVSIPNDIQQMAQDFESIGGDKNDLVAKINEPTPVSTPVDTPPATPIDQPTEAIPTEA